MEEHDDITSGPDEDAGSKRRRLTDAEFASARELYELGKQGLSELADDLGVSRQTLSRRFKDAGVVKGSRVGEVAQAVKATVERYAARRAEWIEETRLESYKALKQVRLIGQNIVAAAVRNTPPGQSPSLAPVDDDMKALGRYNKILLDNYNGVLGLLDAANYTDEEDLPVLQIEDLTSFDILQHHINTGVLPEDATIEDLNADVLT